MFVILKNGKKNKEKEKNNKTKKHSEYTNLEPKKSASYLS